MSNDKISVIIPFKNEEKYLQECLGSVAKQCIDGVAIEVLLIDDHSGDKSPQIAQSFVLDNSLFSYYLNRGDGVVEALQFGLELCTGNYIHRMDADDIMPMNKLSTLYQLLEDNSNLNIATGKVKYFRTDQPLGDGFKKYEQWLNLIVDNSSFYTEIYKECSFASANWLMSKKDLLKIGGFGNRYPEDYDLVFRAYQSKLVIQGSSSITHLWRDHQARASRNIVHYQDNNFFELKLDWFLKLDYNTSKELLLYGAGKKGKFIAKLLLKHKIHFRWFTNNSKKIGKDIYGIVLESDKGVVEVENSQILVLVSASDENDEICVFLKKNSFKQGKDFFVFT